jgi:DedD protein
MNQELKQRLIGAVVVTALAAIFIPMLFDDPVDNSGQSVSELVIPATPVNTGEESANKLPTSVNQVLNTPDAGAETVVNTKEEAELSANKQLPSDETLDDEPEAGTEEGIAQPVDEPEQPVDEPANDSSSTSLDTGVVDQTYKPVKNKKTIQEAESSKQKSTPKPQLETEAVIATPKKPVRKTETSMTTQTTKVKPLTTTLMETLRKQGLPVTMEATKGLYRLKVGPSLEKKRAIEMKAKLDSQKIQSILIAE